MQFSANCAPRKKKRNFNFFPEFLQRPFHLLKHMFALRSGGVQLDSQMHQHDTKNPSKIKRKKERKKRKNDPRAQVLYKKNKKKIKSSSTQTAKCSLIRFARPYGDSQ